MKTPKQIRNEVEKGCGKYIGTWKTSQKIICGCYTNMLELCPKCQAKLSILTEYDKSIKEMIEDLIFHKSRPDSYNQNIKIINVSDIKELLSKIGDVQQTSEEKQ